MVLNFGNNLFGNKDNTVLKNPSKFATIIVAKDGSGDTDDIQEAINLLPKNGGVVLIKDGTYMIVAPVLIAKENIELRGVGKSTILSTVTNATVINITSAGDYCTISNLKILGNVTGTSQTGIVTDGSFTTIKEIYIKDMGGNGIKTLGTIRTLISQNIIEDIGVYGMHLDINNGIVANNIINDCENHAIFLDDTSNCTISGNFLDGSNTGTGDGIYSDDSSQTTISNNVIGSMEGDGINIGTNGCKRISITGNVVHDCDAWGIIIQAAGSDSTIVSNIVKVNASGQISDGGAGDVVASNVV